MRFVPFFLLRLLALLLCWIGITSSAVAATPAGTLIRSQAQAFFLNELEQPVSVLSNEVSTLVQAVSGIQLDADQTRVGVQGQPVVFHHQLTNTGNTGSGYQLSLSGMAGRIFVDRNLTGAVAGNPEVDGPVFLTPGAVQSLLVEVMVPAADSTTFTLTARAVECSASSEAQGRCEAVNSDTLKRTKGVAYEATKGMSTQVAGRGDEVFVTLSFQRLDANTSDSTVTLIDQLPNGLVFNKDSTAISGGSELCAADGEQCRPVSPFRVENNDQTVIYKLTGNSAHEGSVRFAATVTAAAGTTLFNTARYQFCEDGTDSADCPLQDTNRVALQIAGHGVVVNGSPARAQNGLNEPVIAPAARAGSIVDFTNYLWNTGTGSTRYRVTPVSAGAEEQPFPEGSTFCISAAPLCSDFSATPEYRSEILESGRSQALYVRARLPEHLPKEKLNKSYVLTLEARDQQDESVTDQIRNLLVAILSDNAGMDMTMIRPIGPAAAPEPPGILGVGPGSDTVFLTRLSGRAGATVQLEKLFVNNTGEITDQYRLELLPIGETPAISGMSGLFFNVGGVPVVTTDRLSGGTNQELRLAMALPDTAVAGVYSMKVVATSQLSGQQDIVPFQLEISGKPVLSLAPDGRSPVTPGSFITFAHQLTNMGDVPVTSIQLALEDSRADAGWQSLVYRDVDRNGDLSEVDTLITAPMNLAVGETAHLLVKVFAPADALPGSDNITTLSASFIAHEPQSLSVTDTALVSNAQVEITKSHAGWKECHGASLPASGDFSNTNIPVKPGECVVYRLIATNRGSDPVQNVVIHDRAPDFTRFFALEQGVLPLASDQGVIKVSGQIINATWSEGLRPGESVSLQFGIQVQ